MISTPDREHTLQLIAEAARAGARVAMACELMGLDESTYYRWKQSLRQSGSCADRRPKARHQRPGHALSDEECQAVLAMLSSPEYADLSVRQIVPLHMDRHGQFLASESTCCRLLRRHRLNAHRGRSRPARHRKPPATHAACGPNEVWSWDITYLRGSIRGLFFYLYAIIDIWDRSIVGFEIFDRESSALAAQLLERTCHRQGRLSTQPLVLHCDNGSPMKGPEYRAAVQRLGITPSHSRPRVSDDNPFSEAWFRTLKYLPSYPAEGFADLSAARSWAAAAVQRYNGSMLHSGIGYVTPLQRRHGEDQGILDRRREVLEAHCARHPRRFSRGLRDLSWTQTVFLNPGQRSGDRLQADRQPERERHAAARQGAAAEQHAEDPAYA